MLDIAQRNALIEEWMKDIRRVARKAAFDWPGVVEAEDMVQDVVMHILERPGTVVDLEEMDSSSRYQTLHKIAQRIASKERVNHEHFSGNFRYSVKDVRRILSAGGLNGNTVRSGSSWSSEEYISEIDAVADAALNTATEAADLERGLDHLAKVNSRYAELIRRRYAEGGDIPRSESMALSRAVTSLTEKMNHAHKRAHADAPPMRKAIRNSAARGISSLDYEGDAFAPTPDNYSIEGIR